MKVLEKDELMKAVDDARKRVSFYSKEKREELEKEGRKLLMRK